MKKGKKLVLNVSQLFFEETKCQILKLIKRLNNLPDDTQNSLLI